MASGLENIETIESPFRRFVTTIGVFPTAFTDAMTYYECLAYLVKYLEETVIPAVNENAEALKELQQYYIQLKSYVENYFANLDVQEEINNKLDQMAEDGTLQEIITAYIQANVAWTFDTVADMKQATNLVAGSYAQTLGFHALNDGGGAIYYISDSGTANEMNVISVGSLYANLVIDELNVKQWGAYGDGDHDDIDVINAVIKYGSDNKRYDVYLPDGTYAVSKAVILLEFMKLNGNNRYSSEIVKTTNAIDSVDNVDAIIIYRNTSSSQFSYTTNQEITNLSISGNGSNTYGVYSNVSCPFTIVDQVDISNVATGISYTAGWLFKISNTKITPTVNGIYLDGSSTTLTLENTYVYGGNGYGYYLRGVAYSAFNNIACDENTGTAYRLDFCRLIIDGLGCECDSCLKTMEVTNSDVVINSATIIPNATNASYTCITAGSTTRLTLNDIYITTPQNSIAGKFLNNTVDGTLEFHNVICNVPFLTDNTYLSQRDVQKVSNKNSTHLGVGQTQSCGLGHVTPTSDEDRSIANLNLAKHMGAILFNNRGSARYSLDGFDRQWKQSNSLGDLFVNQAPALNGIAITQQTTDREDRAMAGTVSSVNISGSSGDIVVTSLDLEDFSKNRGLVLEVNRKIKSSSGGQGNISAINTGTNTISLTSVTGTFANGDTLQYLGAKDINSTKYSNIQSIGYGNTASRPKNPVSGYMYYDTTLNKPIWFKTGTTWVDATGTTV